MLRLVKSGTLLALVALATGCPSPKERIDAGGSDARVSEPLDAGSTLDATVEADAGAEVDASSAVDTGTSIDASDAAMPTDSGLDVDAGARIDAGMGNDGGLRIIGGGFGAVGAPGAAANGLHIKDARFGGLGRFCNTQHCVVVSGFGL